MPVLLPRRVRPSPRRHLPRALLLAALAPGAALAFDLAPPDPAGRVERFEDSLLFDPRLASCEVQITKTGEGDDVVSKTVRLVYGADGWLTLLEDPGGGDISGLRRDLRRDPVTRVLRMFVDQGGDEETGEVGPPDGRPDVERLYGTTDAGLLLGEQHRSLGPDAPGPSVERRYDEQGRLVYRRSTRGGMLSREEAFTWDDRGRLSLERTTRPPWPSEEPAPAGRRVDTLVVFSAVGADRQDVVVLSNLRLAWDAAAHTTKPQWGTPEQPWFVLATGSLTFDGQGRLVSGSLAEADGPAEAVRYTYGPDGHMSAAVWTRGESRWSWTYSWDPKGRPSAVTWSLTEGAGAAPYGQGRDSFLYRCPAGG